MGININIIYGVMIPFIGTTLGALCVYLMKNELSKNIERMLSGFAAGVMVAASIWSLLIPAMEDSKSLGRFAFMPAIIGFWIGIGFLLMMDHVVPHLHAGSNEVEGPKASLSKEMMLVLAVTLHNIPEGMAVGVVFAGWLTGEANISLGGAFAMACCRELSSRSALFLRLYLHRLLRRFCLTCSALRRELCCTLS